MKNEKLARIRMSLKAQDREYRKRKFREFEKIAERVVEGIPPTEGDMQKVNRYKNPRLLTQNEAINLFRVDFITFKARAASCELPVACVYRPLLRREHFVYPLPDILEHAQTLATPRYRGPYPANRHHEARVDKMC